MSPEESITNASNRALHRYEKCHFQENSKKS